MRQLLTRLLFLAVLTVRNVTSDAATLTVTLVRGTDPDVLGYAVLACHDVPEYCPTDLGKRWQVVAVVDALRCEPLNPCVVAGTVPSAVGPWTVYAVGIGASASAPSNVLAW